MPYHHYINLKNKSQHRAQTRNRKWFIAAVLLNFISWVTLDFEVIPEKNNNEKFRVIFKEFAFADP